MRLTYTLLLLYCIHTLLFSCKNKSNSQPTITVTILPQKYLVEQIAGDYFQINVMVPPGMSPATCDLKIDQLQKLYDSKLCFMIGHLPFERTHLYPILKKHSGIQIINHSEGVHLLHGSCGCSHTDHNNHEHRGVDPHIWLSPKIMQQMGKQVYETLITQYPSQQEDFQKNYKRFISSIDSLHWKAELLFKDYPERSFLIYHPALTYFAADYGLEQISIEDEGKEPNPNHLKKIIDLSKEKKVQFIFIQQQFDTQNAQAIAREINAQIIPIDPLSENWMGEMKNLLKIFQHKAGNSTIAL